jgi:phosphoglycerate dehydrogenase-like enzyme
MGIIGFGRISHRTAQIAKTLKLSVMAFDRCGNHAFVDEKLINIVNAFIK